MVKKIYTKNSALGKAVIKMKKRGYEGSEAEYEAANYIRRSEGQKKRKSSSSGPSPFGSIVGELPRFGGGSLFENSKKNKPQKYNFFGGI